MLNWKFVAYALATIIVAAVAKDAVATDLRLKPTNGLCFITGTTAEEVAVLNFLERAVDGDKVYYSDVFMPCEAIDQIKSGKRAYFYPIFVLMAQKTNGKLLPFTSMTIQKLKAQTEVMLNTHDFTKEIEKQADTLNEMAKESYQTTTFGMTMNEQAIIDVTENTLSVAQKSILVIDGSEKEMTSVITSVIVDGYVAYIQGTDSVSTAKDFWRLQSLTEWTARQIEVAK